MFPCPAHDFSVSPARALERAQRDAMGGGMVSRWTATHQTSSMRPAAASIQVRGAWALTQVMPEHPNMPPDARGPACPYHPTC
jgi:hypothetical protein